MICNSIIAELTSGKLAYDNVITKNSFFLNYEAKTIRSSCFSWKFVLNVYRKDLDITFINECVHFQSYVKVLNMKTKIILLLLFNQEKNCRMNHINYYYFFFFHWYQWSPINTQIYTRKICVL